MTYMAYLLDLAVILFFVLSIVIGCKRGVVKALSRLAGIVAAVVLAFLFCGPLASLTFDRWIGPSLQTTVAEKIEDSRRGVGAGSAACPGFKPDEKQRDRHGG